MILNVMTIDIVTPSKVRTIGQIRKLISSEVYRENIL